VHGQSQAGGINDGIMCDVRVLVRRVWVWVKEMQMCMRVSRTSKTSNETPWATFLPVDPVMSVEVRVTEPQESLCPSEAWLAG